MARGRTRSSGRGARLRRVTRPPRLPARRRDAHKGDFGRVLVIGGSRGMIGAPALAANAALRAGAGLVTVASPASVQIAVATLCPCATSIPLPESADGRIAPIAALRVLRERGAVGGGHGATAVAIGPGLGRGSLDFDTGIISLLRAIGEAGIPTVVDADGINALGAAAAGPGLPHSTIGTNLVLTPHPGEMGRLTGRSAGEVQAERVKTAVDTTVRLGEGAAERPVVVLKGAGTIVTDGAALYVNRTGNPGMATGGTGDVLTGVIAGLIAQGLSRLDAAVLGVYLHGRAGDLAARRLGQHSLTATDVLEALPEAFRKHAK